MLRQAFRGFFFVWLLILGIVPILAQSPPAPAGSLDALVKQRITDGDWLGAQYALGRDARLVVAESVGQVAPDDSSPVDESTLFCIGSVSKSVVVTGMMAALDQHEIDLDEPIDQWLPEFQALRVGQQDHVVRAPSIRELMSHRAGIYSQKRSLTQRQRDLIYTYDHTLGEAVRGIAAEPLIFEPGSDYAYSGAGYCVLGHVFETIVGKSMEAGLSEALFDPLQMSHSTYFPKQQSRKIATGGLRQDGEWIPHPGTPHRTNPHRMTLVCGSLYSTAHDLSTFAKMICQRGNVGGESVLSEKGCEEMFKPQAENHPYALGWSVRWQEKTPVELTHGGALASSRALLRIHLPTRSWVVVLYTLSDPRDPDSRSQQRELGQVTQALVRGRLRQ